ncbi:MAG: hypothetical protein M5R36_23515 [Deltaproteobacteria bacterium]|nr:hypothetical protein [Deltaproteobacteria bacterium]
MSFVSACGGGDDDDHTAGADDDDTEDDDTDADGDLNDDLDDDSADDDTGDDDTAIADDWVAPWPQSAVEPRDYDETGVPGPLRLKAQDYDLWHLENHQPFYGGTVGVRFTDASRAAVESYFDWNDSSEWTGLYLVSQAMRYYVTGDAQAKENAIRIVNTLSGYLHVNGKTGFLSRYWGQQDPLIYPGDAWCDAPEQDRCHHIETGPYAGDFWWGRNEPRHVQRLVLRDVDGVRSGGRRAHARCDPRGRHRNSRYTARRLLVDSGRGRPADGRGAARHRPDARDVDTHRLSHHGIRPVQNRTPKVVEGRPPHDTSLAEHQHDEPVYGINFGNCLTHELWYNLLRLGRAYFSDDDFAFYLSVFNTQAHSFTRLSHNAFFNGVYMGQSDYAPGKAADPYQTQLEEDLGDFRPAPLFRYYLAARDPLAYTLDPLSVFLSDLMDQYPFLEQIMGGIEYQASDAFPVSEQCSTDFLFQRNPFQIGACGSDHPEIVNPGVDYLIAYWMAVYHKFLSIHQ